MERSDMQDKKRIATSQDLLTQLEVIKTATEQVREQLQVTQKSTDSLAALRLRLTAVKH